jgi:hypothetical protein
MVGDYCVNALWNRFSYSAPCHATGRGVLILNEEPPVIWSSERQFCFVHIPKTGGTSITAAYEPFMLFNDIVIGGTVLGEQSQASYRSKFHLHKHSDATEIAKIAGRDRFNAAFCCAIIREPVERMVSFYRWLRCEPLPGNVLREAALALEFESFISKAIDDLVPQSIHVMIDGNIALTRLYRFTDIAAAWSDIAGRFGIAAGPIEHHNASSGAPVEVSKVARSLIEEAYRDDCALYNRIESL